MYFKFTVEVLWYIPVLHLLYIILKFIKVRISRDSHHIHNLCCCAVCDWLRDRHFNGQLPLSPFGEEGSGSQSLANEGHGAIRNLNSVVDRKKNTTPFLVKHLNNRVKTCVNFNLAVLKMRYITCKRHLHSLTPLKVHAILIFCQPVFVSSDVGFGISY